MNSAQNVPVLPRAESSGAPPLQQPSVWRLLGEGYLSLVAATLIGLLISTPFLYLQVRYFTEATYVVGGSPQDDERLVQWALSQPNVVSFKTEREGRELRVRSEYRSFTQQPQFEQLIARMREQGYVLEGMKSGSTGVASSLPDLLADARTLAILLAAMQVGFGSVGMYRIRAAARKGTSLITIFPSRHQGRALLVGVAGGAVLLSLGAAYSLLLEYILGYTPPSPWDSAQSMSAATKSVFLVFGAVGAPLAEEIFFRGYLLGKFKAAGRVGLGILFSAALFGAAHFSDRYGVPVIVLYGAILAWLYHRTQSLWTPIAAHAVNNAVVIGYMTLW